MHIYIGGIGGSGLGPLAEIASQLGHAVSGSDIQDSDSLEKIRQLRPAPTINIGQTAEQIAATHAQRPIDWYVYSSALAWAQPPNPELAWVKQQSIKHSKRDEFLNYLLEEKGLDLLAISGSHGKTTTTAMMIWLLKEMGESISYSLGGKLVGMPAAAVETGSRWFIYEADEFDRNFLSFKPKLSLISGIDHDHPEVFPTMADYTDAFRQFVNQSDRVAIGLHDALALYPDENWPAHVNALQTKPAHTGLKLAGEVNRQNATLALAGARAVLAGAKEEELVGALNRFPGSWRRFEELSAGLYTDYAHNPVKIAGCLQLAGELGKPVVVVYEPHSNQRQHLVKDQYRDLFKNVRRLYWLPTFLTREDPQLPVLEPAEFIKTLSNCQIARPAEMDRGLRTAIESELAAGSIVIGMSASGLDSWLRENFGSKERSKF